jgi:glycosyltransferase involved in cell wall biosynthesis
MRIIIATTIEPFVSGGDAVMVDSLEQMLSRAGHAVETLRLPFLPSYTEMLDQMLALRLFDLGDTADRLIAIRTPSYLLRHRNKVLWFIHHHRSAYDFWGTEFGDMPDTPEGRRYREAILAADGLAFAEARAIFTNSRVVSRRLEHFNQVASEVLYPPLLNPERYVCREYGHSIVYVSRIVRHKRQHLAIEALAQTRTPVRLTIAGPSNDPDYRSELERLADRHGVRERLVFRPEWISESEKIDILSNSLAALYLPWDEDSYGYAALEAQQASKAVVTTSDSGGPLELIEHESNGLVVKADAHSVAAAMDRLFDDRKLAVRLGERGRARISELGITWENVLPRLLA